MAKYIFVCEEEYGVPAKRTVQFEADSLDDILNEFEMFLRGAGFYFKGTLDVVPYDDEVKEEDEYNFDFSNIPQNNWPFGDVKPQSTTSEDSIYISNENDIQLDFGAAQPALNLYDEMDYGPAITIPKSNR